MSTRQLKRIFAVLAVLVAAYVGVQLVSRSGSGAPDGGAIVAAVEGGLAVVRALGPVPGDSVRLEESDGAWTVNGYPADTALVRQLREGLDSARIGRLVARSATNHGRLGVSEDSARRVELGPPDDPTLTFLLGRGGADGAYVRFPPSDEVFTAPAMSTRLLRRSEEEWRSRIVATVDTSAIGRVVVRRDDRPEPVVLERVVGDTTSVWTVGQTPADSAAVGRLLAEAGSLTATGFPSDSVAFSVDFEDPVAVLEMFESDEPGAAPSLSLLFLTAPDAREFLVRRSDDPLSYRISEGQAERLLPTREMLLPDPE